MLLDYPPPTILGYSKDQTSTVIGRIYDHLEDHHIRDDDLILIADGYRAWFQLPSSVLIRQYQRVVADANDRLKKEYGNEPVKRPGEQPEQRFRQTVLFAADTHCWHYATDDVACDAVPDSPMWESAISANASARNIFNPKFLNSGIVMGPARDLRAVFAAASKKSTGQGGVHDLQNALQIIFSEQEQARQVVRRENLGTTGRVREWLYETVYGQSRFRGYGFQGGKEGARKPLNFTIQPGRNYEYAIGLDYGSALFQSMSAPHSFNGDIEFLAADDVLAFPNASAHDLPPALAALPSPFHLLDRDRASADIPDNATTPLTVTSGLDDLPDDLPWSTLPLARNLRTGSVPASLHFPPRLSSSGDVRARSLGASYSSPETNGNSNSKSSSSAPPNSNKSKPHHRLSPLYQNPKPHSSKSKPKTSPLSPGAETLDGIDPGTDTTTPPSLAHLDPRDSIYRHLWFAPYARALLRRHMRQTTYSSLLSNEITAAEDDEALAESRPTAAGAWDRARQRELGADRRGGEGGVWTQQGEWLGWDEVCAGVEEDVFGGDGWGVWGKEREGKGLMEDERKKAAYDERENAAVVAALQAEDDEEKEKEKTAAAATAAALQGETDVKDEAKKEEDQDGQKEDEGVDTVWVEVDPPEQQQ